MEDIYQVQEYLDIFLVSLYLYCSFPIFFYFSFILFSSSLNYSITYFSKTSILFFNMMWPRKCRHLEAITKCKKLANTCSSRDNDRSVGG